MPHIPLCWVKCHCIYKVDSKPRPGVNDSLNSEVEKAHGMTFFTEKVALVTGGGSGIGLAIVETLLERRIKGVAILDISDVNWKKVERKLYAKYHNKILFIKADVTIQRDFEDAFDKTINEFKNLDIVFNNAGIADEVQWERTIAINLSGVVRGTYLARDKYLPKYKCGEEGIIVNTASLVGVLKFNFLPVYSAAKHGVVGLAKALADQNTTKNTRLITFCPGFVRTPLSESVAQEVDGLDDSDLIKTKMSPQFIAESVMKLLQEARHGSIWIIDNEEAPFEINFPETTEMIKQYNLLCK